MSEQTTSTGAEEQDASAPDYGAAYYTNYWGGGGPYERNEQWLAFFGSVADGLVRDFHPVSALDAGCALGFLVEELRRRGVDASGFDVSEYAIAEADESIKGHVRVGSLTEPIEGRFDLVTCIEVLEHLPPSETDAAIANLCAASDVVVVSSTPGDFGEPTHFNVMPPENWAAKFAQHGFFHDLDRDLSYLSPWTAAYVRREDPVAEVVRRYDRGWWRLRREVGELRASLLRVKDELDGMRALDRPPDAKTQAELDRRAHEILRLRDTLIGMEAEMGVVLGQRTQLEDRFRRLESAKRKAETTIPVFGKLLGAVAKLLRLGR